MVSVVLRPTVAADLAQITDERLPHRIKAITGEVDGRVIGVGGLGFEPSGSVVAFVHLRPEARRYAKTLHRAGLMVMRMIRESGYPRVLARTDPDVPAAGRWLRRLGFRFHERLADGSEVYLWQR